MHVMKTIIKKTARYFGIEIKRYTEQYEPTDMFSCWARKLQTSDPVRIVFDIGASRGQTVAGFRKDFPEASIYAFEPGMSAFLELEAGTANDSKIRSFQLAFGDCDGSAKFYENADDVTSSLLPNSRSISQFSPPEMVVPKSETTVPLMRIDTFCAKESICCIDLLKIDAQGYEKYILAGAGSLLTPAIIRGLFLEVLFVDLYENQTWFDEILELL